MDKLNEDWKPSIALSGDVNIIDESDISDSLPTDTMNVDELEFDHSIIQKETMEISDQKMKIALSELPENISEETKN